MLSKSKGWSLWSSAPMDRLGRAAVYGVVAFAVLVSHESARGGGVCTSNTDCNLATNFCRPGVCTLFGQCAYDGHSDTGCRGQRVCGGGPQMGHPCTSNANCPGSTCRPPVGDTLYCNGDDVCDESLNGGVGACTVITVNCLPPTPHCNETLNACVECVDSSDCPTAPRLTCNGDEGRCVECTSDVNCNDGVFCNGQETCNQTTGLCQSSSNVTCSSVCVGGSNSGNACTSPANCPGGGSCQPKFCSEIYQACVGCEFTDDCQDPLYCNGQEVCNATTHLCQAGTPPACKRCNGGGFALCTVNTDCPAGITCTAAGFCDEVNDRCVQCNTNGQCPKDLDYCTDSACVFNTCVQIADPVLKCGDNLWCNGQESCLSSQVGSACQACLIENPNNESVCKTQKRCVGGLHPVCTTDAQCVSAGGTCAPACCGPGSSVDCDDNIACTKDQCDENADACANAPAAKTCNNAARTPCDTNADCPSGFTCTGLPYCDDGLFCDGQEICGSLGCANVTPRVCTNNPLATCLTHSDCPGECSNNSGIQCTSSTECPGGTCINMGQCQVNCSHLSGSCTNGLCNEAQDQCVATPIHQGENCEDDDPCTINEVCTNGQCIPSTTVNNAYKCVRMEWRNVTAQPVNINDTITADLYVVADACGSQYSGDCPAGNMELFGLNALLNWNSVSLRLDPPGSPNPQDPCDSSNSCYLCQTCSGGSNNGLACVQRCSGGPRNGLTCTADSQCNKSCTGGPIPGAFCTTSADCRVCVGGARDGLVCAGGIDCPGGSCPAGGTCSTIAATCSSNVLTCLGGTNHGAACTVPADCPSGTCSTQFTCPGGTCGAATSPSRYNWSTSAFLNDCQSDGVNGPCPFTGFPGNDGDAVYTAIDQPLCDGSPGPPVCVPPAGLFVTKYRFKAIRGGQSELAIDTCTGSYTKTSANSAVSPPAGLTSSDVLKAIGAPAPISVRCFSNADCDDLNVCTTDTCNLANNTCGHSNNTLSCNDGLYCTLTDVCSGGACVGSGVRCAGGGTCVGGSNAGAACTSGAGCSGGWCTAMSICDEPNDRCVQCLSSGTCNDSNLCTQDVCNAAGTCQNPANDCNDGLSCTTDSCVVAPAQPPQFPTPRPVCQHTANNTACSNGLFCSARECEPASDPQLNPTGCVFANPCGPGNGNPCPNAASCNESTDSCGGCKPPTLSAKGSRYIGITPNATLGSTPMAIFVAGDCETAEVACLGKYVSPKCVGGSNNGQACLTDADCPKTCQGGTSNGALCTSDSNCLGGGRCIGGCEKGLLGSTPTFMTAAQWGSIFVHDNDILPQTQYEVFTSCNFGGPPVLSAPSRVTTYRWGDTDGDGDSDFADISGVVNAFKNVYSATQTYQSTNVGGSAGCGDPQGNCIGQSCISFVDVSLTVDAFKGIPFPCTTTCP